MAHHPPQSTPTFRSRRDEPGSLDGSDIDHQQHQSPPSLPLFSSSSDHTITNSSTLSSKSGSSEDGGSATAANINIHNTVTPGAAFQVGAKRNSNRHNSRRKLYAQDTHNRALCKKALMQNDSMVYLDGPQVYTCGNCRTHLTSHDDIISKSFHGRHGRAYLFDQCVNITTGPAEDRFLITGLHSVSDIFCKRCQTLVGWTYAKAYEASQKYKEGKFIIEKINLHLEESDYYNVDRPAGERGDKFRTRSMSWGSERSMSVGSYGEATGSRSPSGVMFGSPTTGPLRGRSGSIGKGGSNSSYLHRTPLTPPTRRSPALAMMSPKSPRSPSDIIYEYRQGDD